MVRNGTVQWLAKFEEILTITHANYLFYPEGNYVSADLAIHGNSSGTRSPVSAFSPFIVHAYRVATERGPG